MRRFAAAVCTLVLAAGASFGAVQARPAAAEGAPAARVVDERRLGPRTIDLTIDSPAMERTEKVRLLLPPGWSKSAGRTWPQLWLLHGGFDDHTSWSTGSKVAELTEGRPVIVVMPNGGPCGSYSDWWNGGRGGPPRWERFHLTEVRQILESDYRAGPERAVAGLSMGGMGAMKYAARHPGVFRAAASFSGGVHTRAMVLLGIAPPLVVVGGTLLSCPGVNPLDLWGDPLLHQDIWRAHNPYDLADRLRGIPLYVSSGTGVAGPYDPPLVPDLLEGMIWRLNDAFVRKLKELEIPATVHFYNGTHSWPYWDREFRSALPRLLAALGAD